MIAREGIMLILVGAAIALVVLAGAVRWDSLLLAILAGVFSVLTVFTVFFFRDPDRSVQLRPGIVVSPADGTVLSIERLDEHEYVGPGAVTIAIFLSIFDVHINRVPVDGTVEYIDFHKGTFFSAFKKQASQSNQRTEIGIVTEEGHHVIVRQITGSIARRVICRLRPEDKVVAGSRFGLIRFGSRTELIVPANSRLNLKPGDKVKGGATVLGFLPDLVGEVTGHEPTGQEDSEL